MEKPISPEQSTLFQIIEKDYKKIMPFINNKSQEHYEAFTKYQMINEWIHDLCEPEFLPITELTIIHLHIQSYYRQIREPKLLQQVKNYILKRINFYITTAESLELFEAVQNLKIYLNLNESIKK